ncbi:hypothetical protein [Streptosporangium canum]|nr:hypothetical protein [Streptosporangium canum]
MADIVAGGQPLFEGGPIRRWTCPPRPAASLAALRADGHIDYEI